MNLTRIFLVFAAANLWPIKQMNINNAFLHGYLDDDIYMMAPEGYCVDNGMVCKLERSLYGLKQASRQWNVEFKRSLQKYGFSQLGHNHCLFTKTTDTGLMALLVYVDDVLISGPSLSNIQGVKAYLHELFTIKDIGNARYFLGFEIARDTIGTYICQHKYLLDIVRDTGLLHSKYVSTPFP
ncbi:UNVERIFIED_CONTAM: Retrovirus-related Pol polyprotein from transposon RE1 [Sesamum radiatum]|uniref:Retrovirus-related Pol polyprotein from transposon RE1 n=1 Tax=Sesamum radiatum TaxID=300843 RepID=A0AAW2U9H2_SESRA